MSFVSEYIEQLKENSLYSGPNRRQDLVEDKEATMTALIINFFGTLGLLKIDAKKVKARRILNSQEQLQIGKIAETHNDMVLVIRLGVDAGIIPVPVARQHFMELYNASPKKDTIQEALSDQGCAAFLPKDQYLVIFKASLATAESMGERFSRISVANEFLKRDDVAKEDVAVVLGRLVKAIEQYDNGDDDVYYTDDSDMITADGAASTISEIISVAMERFPAEVDDSLVTVAGSKLVEQVAGKIAQATILDRFSESYQSDINKPYKAQTREEVLRSMRFNKVGLNLMNSFYDPKKPLSENIKAAESLNVVIEPLKVTPINATEEELIEATAKIERFNKHAHSNGNTGILVLRMFDVSIPPTARRMATIRG